ncbi:MAG: hypothetical protein ACI4BA_06705 [Prevotella sp.]
MYNRLLSLLCLLILLISPNGLSAQRSTRISRKKPQITAEEQLRQEKVTQMLLSTQEIMFIDSCVVDKPKLLEKYILNPEVGEIHTYDRYFETSGQAESYLHLNQLKEKCFFSMLSDDGKHAALYSSDLIDRKWTAPQLLAGIDTTLYKNANYPFMMTDGSTLYFAAQGPESIGGYDIFVTRYDAAGQRFLKPENIGMPFNSEGNDYLYAIDDIEKIGVFVTDRHQPQGKVCIYFFIPNDNHQIYDVVLTGEVKLKNYAAISRIADTWKDKSKRAAALDRLKQLAEKGNKKKDGWNFAFEVNNNTVYTHVSQFKESNKSLVLDYMKCEQRYQSLTVTLADLRVLYENADATKRRQMGPILRETEKEYEDLEVKLEQLAKTIRNNENRGL